MSSRPCSTYLGTPSLLLPSLDLYSFELRRFLPSGVSAFSACVLTLLYRPPLSSCHDDPQSFSYHSFDDGLCHDLVPNVVILIYFHVGAYHFYSYLLILNFDNLCCLYPFLVEISILTFVMICGVYLYLWSTIIWKPYFSINVCCQHSALIK